MATRKMRKFADGGVTDEDLAAANASDDAIATLNARKGWTGTESAPAKPMSFKEAFAAARKDGGKTFEWNGKKYTTELAGEKKSAPRATDTGDETARLRSRATEAKPKYETPYDRMNRKNAEEAAARPSVIDRISSRIAKGREAAASIKSGEGMKCGGKVKGYAKGGTTRGDGIAQRGKTKGRMV